MSQAGPSRPRQSNHAQNGFTPTQKRKRITDVAEIFEKPSIEEQVRLGKEYRALQNEADDMRANMANSTADDIIIAMSKQEGLFVNVKDTGIGTLDANLMKTNTENAMAIAKKFKIDGVAFDIDEFLLKIKGQLGLDRAELADQDLSSDDELEESHEIRSARKGVLGDWSKIGWMAAKYYRRIPGVEFMYGPLSVIHTKRNVGPRQKRQPLAPEVRPEDVQTQEGEKKSKDDFTSNVRMVKRVLTKLDPSGEGINFFELVINPEDFGQSVENCFFVSFLLNQGLAGIDVNDDGEVIIRDTDAHDSELDEVIVKNQAVVELDLKTWEDAKRIFKITKSSIPNRDYSAIRTQMAGNAWYS
ncbi:uncharacterized protein IL334_006400 [Kwoniella shivajii]|uniref:Non-structural maintenance of chromosomes element 4 n=1 Tax=Kwoniella shivajii TaxID=564305 RepID=A0ABZ1D5U9_9TREE|nr:hypothetical protein IL334_006400 [Kwoniella shivajii]